MYSPLKFDSSLNEDEDDDDALTNNEDTAVTYNDNVDESEYASTTGQIQPRPLECGNWSVARMLMN